MTLNGTLAQPAIDTKLEEKIFRKLAVRLFPLLILGILIAYMDRANLGVVNAPMSAELGLTASAFGLAAGVFYLGYLFLEVPSNIAMNRFGARAWLARIMFSWGAVTAAMMFIHDPMSLNITRFLLGAAEAGFYPGIVLYMTFWFPSRLFPRALSIFQLGVPIALAITTVISAGLLLLLDGTLGLSGWRWVFLTQGLATLVLGVAFLAFLPAGPQNAKWLTPDEREYILAHAGDRAGHAHEPGAVKRVVKSGLAWAFALQYFFLTLSFWTITYWMPTVIKDRFGVGTVDAGLLSALPWAVCAVAMYLIGKSSARTGDRRWHLIISLLVGGVGLLASTFFDSPVMVLLFLCIAAAGSQAGLPLFFAQATSVFLGTVAAVAIAFINSLGNVSGFVGPYVIGVLVDLTGNTRIGLVAMSAAFLVSAVLTYVLTRPSIRQLR
ncbi:MFS transporter [Arthrobacter sp. NPDC080031]|uniref:MFS transporter n=1 Tax=Arthrobacter sp. NPDC080031 TaxID=3155918 RepID=UPI00344C0BAA